MNILQSTKSDRPACRQARRRTADSRRSDEASAFIIALGILVILFIMAITFATMMMMESRAARNYNDAALCENVARGVLEEAINALFRDKYGQDASMVAGSLVLQPYNGWGWAPITGVTDNTITHASDGTPANHWVGATVKVYDGTEPTRPFKVSRSVAGSTNTVLTVTPNWPAVGEDARPSDGDIYSLIDENFDYFAYDNDGYIGDPDLWFLSDGGWLSEDASVTDANLFQIRDAGKSWPTTPDIWQNATLQVAGQMRTVALNTADIITVTEPFDTGPLQGDRYIVFFWFPRDASDNPIVKHLPGGLSARYAILISDDREAKAHVNAHGNRNAAGGAQGQNQGVNTYEVSLEDVVSLFSGGSGQGDNIIDDRATPPGGGVSNAGVAVSDDDSERDSPTGRPPVDQNAVDDDADGIVDNEANPLVDEDDEFNPLAAEEDTPFALPDETDLIQDDTDFVSRLETILGIGALRTALSMYSSDLGSAQYLYKCLTTYSAGTVEHPYIDDTEIPAPFSETYRRYRFGLNQFDIDPLVSTQVEDLKEILENRAGLTEAQAYQMIVNLKNALDGDTIIDRYTPDGGTTYYYGVEASKILYITEVFVQDLTPPETGIVSSGTNTTLTDTSKTWTDNQWIGAVVGVDTDGDGIADQIRTVTGNTVDTLTVSLAWGTNPTLGDTYYIYISDPDEVEYAIELYNPTPNDVNIENWVLSTVQLGGTSLEDYTAFTAGTTITAGDHFVISNFTSVELTALVLANNAAGGFGDDHDIDYTISGLEFRYDGLGTAQGDVISLREDTYDLIIDKADFPAAGITDYETATDVADSIERGDYRIDEWSETLGNMLGSAPALGYTTDGPPDRFHILTAPMTWYGASITYDMKFANLGDLGRLLLVGLIPDPLTTDPTAPALSQYFRLVNNMTLAYNDIKFDLSDANHRVVLDYLTILNPLGDNYDDDGDGVADDTGPDDPGFSSPSDDLGGPEHRIPGMININTASKEVLLSLPMVTDNADEKDDGVTDAEDSDLLVDSLDADVIIANRPYTQIGDLFNIAEITALGSNTKDDNDNGNVDEQEEAYLIFGAISNIVTTRSNVFTVYCLAQVGVWNDLNADDIVDPGEFTTFAERKLMAIVDRSTQPINVRFLRWLSD